MAHYVASTQRQSWLFSYEDLRRVRSEANARARARLKAETVLEEELRRREDEIVPMEVSPAKRPKTSDDGGAQSGRVDGLTVEENSLLVRFYERKVPDVCRLFNLPEKVWATGVTYVKRFYLNNTVMDVHPKIAMLAATYLACKIEEEVIPLEEFCARVGKIDPVDVSQAELTILEGLHFHLIVYHPFRSLSAFLHEIQERNLIASDGFDTLRHVAWEKARSSLFTDACLLSSPGEIALTCVQLAAEAIDVTTTMNAYVEEYIQRRRSGEEDLDVRRHKLDTLAKVVGGGSEPLDFEVVKRIDRKLIYCRNPAKDPRSALYKQNKRRREEEKNKRQAEKIEAHRRREAEELRQLTGVDDSGGLLHPENQGAFTLAGRFVDT